MRYSIVFGALLLAVAALSGVAAAATDETDAWCVGDQWGTARDTGSEYVHCYDWNYEPGDSYAVDGVVVPQWYDAPGYVAGRDIIDCYSDLYCFIFPAEDADLYVNNVDNAPDHAGTLNGWLAGSGCTQPGVRWESTYHVPSAWGGTHVVTDVWVQCWHETRGLGGDSDKWYTLEAGEALVDCYQGEQPSCDVWYRGS